jgi:hypothetical protein
MPLTGNGHPKKMRNRKWDFVIRPRRLKLHEESFDSKSIILKGNQDNQLQLKMAHSRRSELSNSLFITELLTTWRKETSCDSPYIQGFSQRNLISSTTPKTDESMPRVIKSFRDFSNAIHPSPFGYLDAVSEAHQYLERIVWHDSCWNIVTYLLCCYQYNNSNLHHKQADSHYCFEMIMNNW